MSKVQLDLTYKQVFFLIESLDFQIKNYEKKLEMDTTTENECADIENDLISMRPTLEYLRKLLNNYKNESISQSLSK